MAIERNSYTDQEKRLLDELTDLQEELTRRRPATGKHACYIGIGLTIIAVIDFVLFSPSLSGCVLAAFGLGLGLRGAILADDSENREAIES